MGVKFIKSKLFIKLVDVHNPKMLNKIKKNYYHFLFFVCPPPVPINSH